MVNRKKEKAYQLDKSFLTQYKRRQYVIISKTVHVDTQTKTEQSNILFTR